ncbi:MAG TPA: P-loop NTPase [Firmicutes bacterium]|nr:P-loop NTPase [Bacillota bacterium]
MVIAVTSGKGGTGKTSFCCYAGQALAELGYRTVILELDFGLRGLDLMLGMQDRVVYDLGDVFSGGCDVSKALIPVDFQPNLVIMAASSFTERSPSAEEIASLCAALRPCYDYILLDMPAGIGFTRKIEGAADLTLIIVTPDPVCIRDGNRMVLELGAENTMLVINKVNKRRIVMDRILDLDRVIDGVGVRLLGVVPEDLTLQSAMIRGKPLPRKSRARQGYQNIAGRLTGRDIPLFAGRVL